MSRIGLKFSQMILHTSTSKMMNNLPFLLVVLHKPTLWPSTFKATCIGILFCLNIHKQIAYHQAGLENIIELIKEINFSILVRA